jgi:hypothetical protein
MPPTLLDDVLSVKVCFASCFASDIDNAIDVANKRSTVALGPKRMRCGCC